MDEFILNALREDMPNGDITTDNIIPCDEVSHARFIAKEDGIVSGINIAKRVFELVGGEFTMEIYIDDGAFVRKGDIIARIQGKTRTILKGERVALNILQRMSGIATETNRYVSLCEGNTKILDTRKTVPNMRYFDKIAVTHGHGVNHRFSLSDMVMIKDNHIEAAGSITEAVNRCYGKVDCQIEVEVENIDMFKEALETPCDIIMLDNMSNDEMAECVKLNQGRKKLEASGNMTLSRIRDVSLTGVDYISVGAITHSVKALDISLKFK